VVSTRGRHPEDIQRYNARRGDDLAGLPVVVLVNGASASAPKSSPARCRIAIARSSSAPPPLAKARANRDPLQGGRDGALRLTTARYYTPSGRSIQGQGITPDMEVSARRVDVSHLQRLGITEADLPNALQNENGGNHRAALHVPADQPPANWSADADYQLKRAKISCAKALSRNAWRPAPGVKASLTATMRRHASLVTRARIRRYFRVMIRSAKMRARARCAAHKKVRDADA